MSSRARLCCSLQIFVFCALLITGCFRLPSPTPTQGPFAEPVLSPYVLAIESVPLEQTLQYFNDDLSRLKLNTYEEWFQRGANGWFSVYKAGTDETSLHSGITWIVPSDESLVGYLIVQSAWKYVHDLGIIFTLDYQQTPLVIQDERKLIYVIPQMVPGERRALRIRIPPLAEGVHQLSAIYVPDVWSKPPDIVEYVTQLNQGSGISMSILSVSDKIVLSQVRTELSGDRLPLGLEHLITGLETRPFRPEEIVHITLATLSESPSSPGREAHVMLEDQLRANEVMTYFLKLLGCSPVPYSGEFPIQIGVFWDDVMSQSDLYAIPAYIPCEGRSIPVTVRSPSVPGEYTLMVVVYLYPGYSPVDWSGPPEKSWWMTGAHVHIASRAWVTVVP